MKSHHGRFSIRRRAPSSPLAAATVAPAAEARTRRVRSEPEDARDVSVRRSFRRPRGRVDGRDSPRDAAGLRAKLTRRAAGARRRLAGDPAARQSPLSSDAARDDHGLRSTRSRLSSDRTCGRTKRCSIVRRDAPRESREVVRDPGSARDCLFFHLRGASERRQRRVKLGAPAAASRGLSRRPRVRRAGGRSV